MSSMHTHKIAFTTIKLGEVNTFNFGKTKTTTDANLYRPPLYLEWQPYFYNVCWFKTFFSSHSFPLDYIKNVYLPMAYAISLMEKT